MFGHEANATHLVGKHVGLAPGASANGDVIWQCGKAGDPSGWSVGATSPAGDDHDDRRQVPAVQLPLIRNSRFGQDARAPEWNPRLVRGFFFGSGRQ